MDAYLGTIMMCAWNFTPTQYAACNGAILQITQNSALFALLGTVFGGDGTRTFGLPNLEGRTPVNRGQVPGGTVREFGVPFGQDNMTLTQTQLPAHTHTIGEKTAGQTVTATASATANANSNNGGMPLPTNHYWAAPNNAGTQTLGYAPAKNAIMASDAVTVTVTPTFNASNLAIGNTGSGTAFSLAQPSLALNFCICTAGIFPTRT